MISIQFKHGSKWVECVKVSSLEHLKFHTPNKSGTKSWRIVNEVTNNVINSYLPYPKPKRQKPISSFIGSWAAEEIIANWNN